MEKVEVLDSESCWNWKGSLGGLREQRARFGLFGKNRAAARVMWILLHGEIPKGLNVCHKCDNPKCVNPNHLFLGTQIDNILDCKNKGRIAKGEQHHKTHLTNEQVSEIRSLPKKQGLNQILAKKFGISSDQVCKIRNGKYWRHLL